MSIRFKIFLIIIAKSICISYIYVIIVSVPTLILGAYKIWSKQPIKVYIFVKYEMIESKPRNVQTFDKEFVLLFGL